MKDGACRGVVPRAPGQKDIFFPGKGQSSIEGQMMCFGCKVRLECDDYRNRMKEAGEIEHGVWGGSTTGR